MRNIKPSSMTVEDSLENFGKKLNKVVNKDGIKQDNPVCNVLECKKAIYKNTLPNIMQTLDLANLNI